MTYYGRWTYKYEEAARQGAAGAFIVHDTEPAAYGWNVVQSSWTGPQYNLDEPGGHMDQSKVIGWLTNDAAQRLLAASGQDLAALAAAAKRPGFRAVPLRTRASVSLDQRDQAPGLAQRRRHPAGREAARANMSSTPPIGTISAAATPIRPATTSATARSTMRPAPPA